MWISQFHSIFVQKVFGHSAFDRLPIFQLEGKTLHLCRFPCDVADSGKMEVKCCYCLEIMVISFYCQNVFFSSIQLEGNTLHLCRFLCDDADFK